MRWTILLILLVGGVAGYAPARAQSVVDSTAVRRAALDYIEGWYTADSVRMKRALHPDLVKRLIGTNDRGRSVLGQMGMQELVLRTGDGGGSDTPPELRSKDVEILDLYGGMASVKVISARYVDYMHLALWNGEWKILNVLWDFRPDGDPTAGQDRPT